MLWMAGSPLGLPFISQVYFPWLYLSITFSSLLVLHTFSEAASNPLRNIQDAHKAGAFWLFELVLERLRLETALSSPLPTLCPGRGRRGWHHACFPLVLCNGFEVLRFEAHRLTGGIIGRMTGGGISLWWSSQCSADKEIVSRPGRKGMIKPWLPDSSGEVRTHKYLFNSLLMGTMEKNNLMNTEQSRCRYWSSCHSAQGWRGPTASCFLAVCFCYDPPKRESLHPPQFYLGRYSQKTTLKCHWLNRSSSPQQGSLLFSVYS